MSAARRKSPPPPPKPTMQEEIYKTLFGKPARTLTTLAAVLIALGTIFGYFKPIVESGPAPLAGRVEVTNLEKALKSEFDDHIDKLSKTIDETLEVAKAANVAAQQSIQYTNDSRLDRLVTLKAQLEDQIRRNPGDLGARATLEKTVIDISKLTMQAPTSSPALSPK